MNHNFDAVIIGAGAAGLMCAIEAGKRGRRVAVLERADRAGKKILISGGGRCNFTNLYCQPENFISANPHFAKSALARYTPSDFISLVEKHGIRYHEKTLGQLFCDRSAEDITNMLEAECKAAGVQIFLGSRISEVRRASEFVIQTQADEFRAETLVVASGGLSIPKIGATNFGHQLARQFGLAIIQPRPALAPLLFNASDKKLFCDLAGVSLEVIATANRRSFREGMLITHHGLSGPAILQVSSYWNAGDAIHIDLAPDREVTTAIRDAEFRSVSVAKSAFQGFLPNRFATRWLELHEPTSWTNHALEQLEREAHDWTLTPADTGGYEKAEVTAGGVDTNELSSKTMESRKVPGLFFIGEVVDVTGHLGGHNFQWAWASGASAGRTL